MWSRGQVLLTGRVFQLTFGEDWSCSWFVPRVSERQDCGRQVGQSGELTGVETFLVFPAVVLGRRV
jgi:hypothetical protein